MFFYDLGKSKFTIGVPAEHALLGVAIGTALSLPILLLGLIIKCLILLLAFLLPIAWYLLRLILSLIWRGACLLCRFLWKVITQRKHSLPPLTQESSQKTMTPPLLAETTTHSPDKEHWNKRQASSSTQSAAYASTWVSSSTNEISISEQ